MRNGGVKVSPNDKLVDAMKKLMDDRVHMLPVVEGSRPVGVLYLQGRISGHEGTFKKIEANYMDRIPLIRELCEKIGVSGFEGTIRRLIADKIASFVDTMRVDVSGNLIALINPGSDFTVMADTHMDEIGFIVSYVEAQGFLRFSLLGGWDSRVLPAHQVKLQSTSGQYITGTIGMAPRAYDGSRRCEEKYSGGGSVY